MVKALTSLEHNFISDQHFVQKIRVTPTPYTRLHELLSNNFLAPIVIMENLVIMIMLFHIIMIRPSKGDVMRAEEGGILIS